MRQVEERWVYCIMDLQVLYCTSCRITQSQLCNSMTTQNKTRNSYKDNACHLKRVDFGTTTTLRWSTTNEWKNGWTIFYWPSVTSLSHGSKKMFHIISLMCIKRTDFHVDSRDNKNLLRQKMHLKWYSIQKETLYARTFKCFKSTRRQGKCCIYFLTYIKFSFLYQPRMGKN
jgi:hypothetical protein